MSHQPLYQPAYLALRSRLTWKKGLGLLFGAGMPLAVVGSTLGAGMGVPSTGRVAVSGQTSFVDVDVAARGFADVVGQHLLVQLPALPVAAQPAPRPASLPTAAPLTVETPAPAPPSFVSTAHAQAQASHAPVAAVSTPQSTLPSPLPAIVAREQKISVQAAPKLAKERAALAKQAKLRAQHQSAAAQARLEKLAKQQRHSGDPDPSD